MKVSIKSLGGGSLTIDDFQTFTSKECSLKLPGGKTAFRSRKVGESKMPDSQAEEVVFSSAVRQDRVMSRVIVYHGAGVDGIEFVYDDDSTQLFGRRGGKEGGDAFEFGEYLFFPDITQCKQTLIIRRCSSWRLYQWLHGEGWFLD